MCAAPLALGHPREGGQALDRSAAADALPLEAVLLHLDTHFELHRLSHGIRLNPRIPMLRELVELLQAAY